MPSDHPLHSDEESPVSRTWWEYIHDEYRGAERQEMIDHAIQGGVDLTQACDEEGE